MIGIILFFLVSVHLAIGMLASLLPLSPKTLGERFFRFNGTISLILLALAQSVYYLYKAQNPINRAGERLLYWTTHIESANPWIWVCAALALTFILSLPFQKLLLSRALLTAATLTGVVALGIMTSQLGSRAIPPSYAALIFSLGSLLSALVLGTVTICMVLGHWYLVAPAMSVRHLKIVAGLFLCAVIARVLLGCYTSVLIWNDLEASGIDILSNFVLVNLVFFAQRVLFGLALPLALSWMIWQTVKIRSTQSATGILYVALIFILFGEFLSHYFLVSTGYPI